MGRPNIFRVVDGALVREDQSLEEQPINYGRSRNSARKVMDQYERRMAYLRKAKYIK